MFADHARPPSNAPIDVRLGKWWFGRCIEDWSVRPTKHGLWLARKEHDCSMYVLHCRWLFTSVMNLGWGHRDPPVVLNKSSLLSWDQVVQLLSSTGDPAVKYMYIYILYTYYVLYTYIQRTYNSDSLQGSNPPTWNCTSHDVIFKAPSLWWDDAHETGGGNASLVKIKGAKLWCSAGSRAIFLTTSEEHYIFACGLCKFHDNALQTASSDKPLKQKRKGRHLKHMLLTAANHHQLRRWQLWSPGPPKEIRFSIHGEGSMLLVIPVLLQGHLSLHCLPVLRHSVWNLWILMVPMETVGYLFPYKSNSWDGKPFGLSLHFPIPFWAKADRSATRPQPLEPQQPNVWSRRWFRPQIVAILCSVVWEMIWSNWKESTQG